MKIGDKVRIISGKITQDRMNGWSGMSIKADAERLVGTIIDKSPFYDKWRVKWDHPEASGSYSYVESILEVVENYVPPINPTRAFVLSQKSAPKGLKTEGK
jgi:hypothetical protein